MNSKRGSGQTRKNEAPPLLHLPPHFSGPLFSKTLPKSSLYLLSPIPPLPFSLELAQNGMALRTSLLKLLTSKSAMVSVLLKIMVGSQSSSDAAYWGHLSVSRFFLLEVSAWTPATLLLACVSILFASFFPSPHLLNSGVLWNSVFCFAFHLFSSHSHSLSGLR